MVPLLISYGALFVVWLANHAIGVLLMIAWTLYVLDVTFRPRIKCRMCGGTGMILKRGRSGAQCPACRGRKIHTRLGSRIWRRNRFMFRDDPEAETEEEGRESLHDRGWW